MRGIFRSDSGKSDIVCTAIIELKFYVESASCKDFIHLVSVFEALRVFTSMKCMSSQCRIRNKIIIFAMADKMAGNVASF
jgi:hypothetical protein